MAPAELLIGSRWQASQLMGMTRRAMTLTSTSAPQTPLNPGKATA